MVRRNGFFWFLAAVLSAGIAIAYSNHFENGFHFDDSHVIEQNLNIRGLANIPNFLPMRPPPAPCRPISLTGRC